MVMMSSHNNLLPFLKKRFFLSGKTEINFSFCTQITPCIPTFLNLLVFAQWRCYFDNDVFVIDDSRTFFEMIFFFENKLEN